MNISIQFPSLQLLSPLFIGLLVFCVLFLIDSLWYPFPYEYAFGWWVSWVLIFGMGWFVGNSGSFQWGLALYLTWFWVRWLPQRGSWKTHIAHSILSKETIQKWEDWSYRSFYRLSQQASKSVVHQEKVQISSQPIYHEQEEYHPHSILKKREYDDNDEARSVISDFSDIEVDVNDLLMHSSSDEEESVRVHEQVQVQGQVQEQVQGQEQQQVDVSGEDEFEKRQKDLMEARARMDAELGLGPKPESQ